MNKTKTNQLKMGVVLSYLTTGTQMVVNLVYTPVMIRLIGQSEYGLYTLVGSVVSYLSLFSLGFTGSYLRFYSRYKNENDSNKIASLNGMFLILFLGMSVISLVCGFIMAQYPAQIFGGNLTDYELSRSKILLLILVINMAMTFPASIFDSIISANEQFIFQRIIALLSVVFNPLICLPLLIMGYGSVMMVTVTTIITLSKLLVSIWYSLNTLKTKFDFHNFDFNLLKEISSFSFFIFLNMIIDQINWSVDKLILGRVIGTVAVAVYGVGSTINYLYINFSSSISSVFAPRINRIAAAKNLDMNEQFTNLFIKVGRIQFLVLALICTGFIFFGKYFITNIYAGPDYMDSYYVVLYLILPVTIPLIQNIGLEIQRSVNKHKWRSVLYLFMAVFNILISIPLAKKFGPIGAAMGTGISLLISNGLLMNIYYQKSIGINIIHFWKEIGKLSIGLIIPILFGIFVSIFIKIHSVFMFVTLVCLYSIIYMLSMYKIGMNDYERKLIIKNMKRRQ